MTEPTEAEVRLMAEWAGVRAWDVLVGPWRWNDGRLLWAMLERLGVEDGTTHGLMRIAAAWARSDCTAPEAMWAACREVMK